MGSSGQVSLVGQHVFTFHTAATLIRVSNASMCHNDSQKQGALSLLLY